MASRQLFALLLLGLFPALCLSAQPSGASSGDPVFSGFDSSTFAFRGMPFSHFNILSELNHQITAFFTPAVQHDHNGTYITAFGIQFDIHRVSIYVEEDGHLSVELNSLPVQMAPEQTTQIIRLGNQEHPDHGNLTVTYDLYRPYFGEIVELSAPMLAVSIWSVAPGTDEDGGTVQPAFLDSKISLTAPPANNAMRGVLGETFANLVLHLTRNAPLPSSDLTLVNGSEKSRVKANGLFDNDFEDNLFEVDPAIQQEQRRRLEEVEQHGMKFPLSAGGGFRPVPQHHRENH